VDPVFIAAGDIGYPAPNGAAESTGNLVRSLVTANPDAKVITLGDNAYGNSNDDQGSANSYATLYEPAWGSFVGITLPVPGNHDYGNWDLGACYECEDGGARVMSGYYAYFAGKAITVGGTSDTTLHYGYDFTTKGGEKWRYESLNSGYCFYTPSNCAVGSNEYEWFSTELGAHLKKSKGGTYAGIVVGTHFDANESQECGGKNTQVDPWRGTSTTTSAFAASPRRAEPRARRTAGCGRVRCAIRQAPWRSTSARAAPRGPAATTRGPRRWRVPKSPAF
jgi:hypothetical protein